MTNCLAERRIKLDDEPRFCRGIGGFFVCGGIRLTSENTSPSNHRYVCRKCVHAYGQYWYYKKRGVRYCKGKDGILICGGVELTPETASNRGIHYGYCKVCYEEWKLQHQDDFLRHRHKLRRESYETNRDTELKRSRNWRHREHELALKILGIGGLRCTCCGEQHLPFLTCGHKINGGEPKLIGIELSIWINKHPEEARQLLQIECLGCNMAREFRNICPHQMEKTGEIPDKCVHHPHIHDDCENDPHCGGEYGISWCGGSALDYNNWTKNNRAANRRVCKHCRTMGASMFSEATRIYGLDALGGKCACCGEWRHLLLQYSHLDDDGYKDRARWGGGQFYNNFYNNGFVHDKNLICECANCNHAKRTNGGICPHKQVTNT